MLIEKGDISIRNLQYSEDDFGLMEKWLNDPDVLQYYEGTSKHYNRDAIIKKFGPRARGESDVVACIFEYQKKPIGYVQYYPITEQTRAEMDLSDGQDVYGIDIFLGETRFWNQGLGTKTMKALIEYLFEVEKANQIIIDPQTWNTRAIRCYEKCGFKAIKVLEKHELFDGEWRDNLMMELSGDE